MGAAARPRPRALHGAHRAGRDRRVRRPLPRARRASRGGPAPRSPRSSCSPPSTSSTGSARTRSGCSARTASRSRARCTRSPARAPATRPSASSASAARRARRSPSRSRSSAPRCWPATARSSPRPPTRPRAAERIAGVVARAGIPEGLVRLGATGGCPSVVDLAAGPTRARRDARARRRPPRATPSTARCGARAPAAGRLAGSVKRAFVAREHAGAFVEELALAARGARARRPAARRHADGAARRTRRRSRAAIDEAVALGATLHSGGPAGASRSSPASPRARGSRASASAAR